ncbi:MAG: hypothetical protein ACKVU4_03725 [Phycisphaerales bacterium]
MNPDLVYARYRDDALAHQFTLGEYATFVAMPFGEVYSYRSTRVFEEVVCKAAERANVIGPEHMIKRRFARPMRIDQSPGFAVQITDEILKAILYSHFVLGDVTTPNAGVHLEVGAALALKPNERIVLITQGRPEELHFDIRGKNVVNYNSEAGVEKIAEAICAAALSFESDRQKYLNQLSAGLTADAILLLNWYGQGQSGMGKARPPLFEDNPPPYFKGPPPALSVEGWDIRGTRPRMCFALRELLDKHLIMNDYKPQQRSPEGVEDRWGYHATELGWAFIEYMWPACDGHPGLRRPT